MEKHRKVEDKDYYSDSEFATLLWPDLPKPDIMTHFGNWDFCISEFYIPKALFCSNINAVL